jgi:L-ascorbate metabolism protein UlaG (beta-lactamase superfamily)
MDLATLKRLWERDKPSIITSLGNDAILRSRGIVAQGVDWGARQPINSGEVVVTRNHHWGSRWFADRNRALWSSFTVRLRGGNLFFAGDTGLGDGKWPAEAAAFGPIRLALVPIGAFRFRPGQMGTGSHIGPIDAVKVFEGLGRPRTVPIHWGTFRLSFEAYGTPPKLLSEAMRCAGHDPRWFAPVQIGQTIEVPTRSARTVSTRPRSGVSSDRRAQVHRAAVHGRLHRHRQLHADGRLYEGPVARDWRL